MPPCLTDEKRAAVAAAINDGYDTAYISFKHDVSERQMQRMMRNLLLYDSVVSSQHRRGPPRLINAVMIIHLMN